MPDRPNSHESDLYSKVMIRLLPILMIGYVLAYLDRVNIGFVKLQIQSELALSDAVYGLGAGIFFVGYFLFETSSNMILARVGAKIWLSRIILTWGIVSTSSLLVNGEKSFYFVRFLLGFAEAGFFPGVILYLTYWFPNAQRGSVTALFYLAIPIASALGGPLSGWIMTATAGMYGLSGWQWLFLLEGAPTVVFGLIVFFYLDDKIADARWLSKEEKAFLEWNLQKEESAPHPAPWYSILGRPGMLRLTFINFSIQVGIYGIGFWLPQLVRNTGVTSIFAIGLLSAIPWTFAACGMLFITRLSDKRSQRNIYLIACMLAGAAALACMPTISTSTGPAMVVLSIATLGILTALPLFWTIPTSMLCSATAATGIGMINSFGSLGGFVAPYFFGALRDATNSTAAGIYFLSSTLVIGAVSVAILARRGTVHSFGSVMESSASVNTRAIRN